MSVLHTQPNLSPAEAMKILRSHILVDGFAIVLDLQASRGSTLVDAMTGRRYLDFYGFFASQPVGPNHPRLHEPPFQKRLLTAATTKVTNSDVYTQYYGEFVQALSEIAGLPGLTHYFFIDGGALAIENGLKAAFDWKVRKNLAAGRGELGSRVLHFRQAFHGRSGYTMSLTNTDPNKVLYFPKFDWPRIDNPPINFALEEPARTQDVAAREARALAQIQQAIARHPHDIAALIIEPIQAEGGDNHFRAEFFRQLRDVCDRHEIILIFDEVQTGVGLTGKMWCCQHFGVLPDILVFGKKMQICGIMASDRLNEVDSVFKISSRINSTWGGNLADMVRATEYLHIIRDENLPARCAEHGQALLSGLTKLCRKHHFVTAPRGRGLMCAFDLPNPQLRAAVRQTCYEHDMLVLASGERSIRFRPVLDIPTDELSRGIEILDRVLTQVGQTR